MNRHSAISVDLGSSSGRVILGTLTDGRISQTQIHRFEHRARMVDGYLSWDLDLIWDGICEGLRQAVAQCPDAATVAIDTWGVDYVPMDATGLALTPGRCYRDERTQRTREAYQERLPDDDAWRLTGIAPATINTANQLLAFLTEEPDLAARTSQILLLPDYFAYLLTGVSGWSRSHASTSGLCLPGADMWCDEVFERLGIPRAWVADISPEHDVVGRCRVPGLEHLTVVRAGAHDTACAVQALAHPADEATYFLSCGSWSVLGVLRDEALLSAEARELGLTNEACAATGMRPLFNITGLWMLQECQREWREAGQGAEIADLVAQASAVESLGVVFDPDEPQFAAPGDMSKRVVEALRRLGAPENPSRAEIIRSILEALAARYQRGLEALEKLTGTRATALALTGGGSRNALLCDLTAKALGIPVLAGPAEASTLGSLAAQFRIRGLIDAATVSEVLAASAAHSRHLP
ncbi:MAG: rhamnulokinase [Arachnia sp.]